MNCHRMKSFHATLAALFFFVLACSSAIGQQASSSSASAYTRYRIVFLPGTFGGSNSHFSIFGAHILNNDGSFVGWSDTSLPDPFAPDGCWDGDCFVAQAFLFEHSQMTDLGSLAQGFSSDVNWMSPSGLISGEAQTGEVDPNLGWTMHGVLWAHGKMIDLGTLEGGAISLTTGVNDSAEVIGFALNTIPDPYSMFFGNQTRAYRWKNGVMTDLGTLGGPDAMALRINQRGQIAGNSYINLDPSIPGCNRRTGAFVWEQGKMTDLGGFGGTCTTVSDMNNRGQIVGGSLLTGDNAQHPFLWERGKLTDLGTTGGNFAAGLGINETGDVTGFQTLPPDDALFHAALWTGGKIFDLGALTPGGCSIASSVNSQQQVVGLNSSDCDFGDDPSLRAVISERGGPVVDLNTLIPPNSGMQLRNASIINERGEIVAVAFFANGNHSPVLLVPCESGPDAASDSCQNTGAPPPARPNTQAGASISAKPSPWIHNKSVQGKQFFGSAPWISKKR